MKKVINITLCGLALLLLSFSVQAASRVLYFPADYNASSGRPADITSQAEFVPICEVPDDIYSVRLEGLDMVRGFTGAATCQVTAISNRLTEEAEYVFLVDDTTDLSDYLKTQMRQKSALQTIGGREVIKPSVVSFSAEGSRQGFKILVVGETAFANASTDEAGWFATVNGQFAADQVIAGGSASGAGSDDIWLAYHGMYFNKAGQWLEDVSIEKMLKFFEEQVQKLESAAGASTPVTPSAPSLPSPPPLPSRPLNGYMEYCHNNLVPLPPVWNPSTGGSQWQRRGVVANPFAAPGLSRVEVWTYSSSSPEGICFALPRMSGGNINTDIEALGIVCQSKQSGKACFWDNVVRPTSTSTERRPVGRAKITGAATRGLDPVNMSDGYNLEENCTACHRGSNAFLVQDGTPLDTHSEMPNVRYAPLSGTSDTTNSADWANPISTVHSQVQAASSGSQCTSCHDSDNEFPELTSGYCSTILKCSIGVNMPPSNSANWASSYMDEVMALSLICCTTLGVDLALADASGNQLNPNSATCVDDTDSGGIRDSLDQCLQTPSGETVNAAGCSSTQIPTARCSSP